MLLGLVIAHTVVVGELVGSSSGGACITAVSLTPMVGQGDAQVFEARYAHCEGASAFRIVQLWVGDEVTPTAMRLNLGYEAGALFIEDGGSCAPQDPVTLTSTYGGLDCAGSTVSQSGNEVVVRWSLVFDVDTFAGVHGVWFDAKGGSGDPEPRLEWTQMGTFTVLGGDASTGAADGSSDGGPTGDTTTSDATNETDVIATSTGATGTDEGGLPGGAPRRGGPAGCACGTTAPGSSVLIGLVALGIRRRTRRMRGLT